MRWKIDERRIKYLDRKFGTFFEALYDECKYLMLDERDSKIWLLSAIRDQGLKKQIKMMIKSKPNQSFLELGSEITLYLGGESVGDCKARVRTLVRGDREPLQAYAVESGRYS